MIKKPKMLYASPFWPKKSGISEYSEALVIGLDNYFEVTLLTDDYEIDNQEIKNHFPIVTYKDKINYDSFDFIIYNMGNNPDYHKYMYDAIKEHPGHIILHDYILYYLTVGYYQEKNQLFQKIYELEGNDGIQIVKNSLRENEIRDLRHHTKIASKLPMNSEIIKCSKGIFVHSNYTADLIRKDYQETALYRINLVVCEVSPASKDRFLNETLGIKDDEYIIGAAGFIADTKQNELTCLAVRNYNENHDKKIHYVMIGEGNYVDHLLDDYIHKTGFLNNENFFQAINSCDLIMNLRYPYQGESSATQIQCMSLGKPCVVTDIGWFSELPDDTVVKLPFDIGEQALSDMFYELKNKDLSDMISRAQTYIKNNCMPEAVASTIYAALKVKQYIWGKEDNYEKRNTVNRCRKNHERNRREY